MRNLLLILLVVTFSANSAEFVFNGSIVRSAIEVREVACKGYSVLVKVDSFPYETESSIPEDIKLSGFRGPDIIVSATAFVKNASAEHEISIPVEKYQEKGNLLKGRAYIPSFGYCLSESTFLLSIWSGGNCTKCELLIKYKINPDGSAAEMGLPSREEIHKALGR